MTLALYGKSRRRKGALLTAALLAVIIATVGALGAVTSAFAHHNEYAASGTCDGWTATANYVGGNNRVLVVMDNVKIGGQDYQGSWSSGFETGEGSSGGVVQQTSSTTSIGGRNLPTSGTGAITLWTNVWYWYGIDNAATIFNRSGGWPAGAFSGRILLYYQGSNNTWSYSHADSITPEKDDRGTITAPTRPKDCDRTIRIVKVTTGKGRPSSWSFSGTISDVEPKNWTLTNAQPSTSYKAPKNEDIEVKENAPGDGWVLVGYDVKKGVNENCSSKESDYKGESAQVKADENNYTVCILNEYTGKVNIQVHKYLPKNNPNDNAPWENQGNGQSQWTFTVYGSLADAQNGTNPLATFSQLGSNSPDLPQTDLWVKETGMPAGHQFFGWFVPDGDNNSGNDKCNQRKLDGSDLTSTGAILHIPASHWSTKGNKTGLFHICAYNKPKQPDAPQVSKVAKNPGYQSGYARWVIKISNGNGVPIGVQVNDSGVENDGSISGGTCSDSDISDGQMTCTVNAGQTLEVPVKKAVTQQCKEDKAENKATIMWRLSENAQWSSDLTATGPSITIPPDESKCGLPEIKKEASQTSQTSDPNDVAWVVTVSNPNSNNGITRNVIIKELSNVTVVSGSSTGGAGCSASFTTDVVSSSGAACTMPAGSTLTFTVKPNPVPQRECRDKDITNTVELYLAGDPPTKLHTASSTITLLGNPDLCTTTVKICKVVEDNGDGYTRPKGTFVLTVTASSQTTQHAIDAAEGGGPACKDVTVPANATIIAVGEAANRPTGWNGDAQGYPKVSGPDSGTYTVTNKEKVVKNVTFSKYICDTFGDVPRNEGPGGQDDTGKNAYAGGLNSLLGGKGPSNDSAPVDPSNDNRGSSCKLATTPWTFNLWTNARSNGSGGSLLQTFAVTGSQSVLLNQAVIDELVAGRNVYVEEVYQTGYAFGALKCYTDHLNDDNWEWLYPSILPEQGTVHCIAYNVPVKTITIQKVWVGDSEITKDDYPIFTLEGFPFDKACTGPQLSSPSGTPPVVTGTWTCTVPVGWNGKVTEVPATGWKQCDMPNGNGNGTFSAQTEAYGFTNCKLGKIIVHKVYPQGTPTDSATFSGTISNNSNTYNWGPLMVNGSYTIENVVPGPYDVSETLPSGYELVGIYSATSSTNPGAAIACGAQTSLVADVPDSPDIMVNPGETLHVWVCNRPLGTVVIVKYENVPPATAQTWTFTGNSPILSQSLSTTGTTNSVGTASTTILNVPAGSYTVAETQGRGRCETGTTSSDWETRGLVQVGGSLPTAGDVNSADIIGSGSLNVPVKAGTTTYVVFGNIGCGSVLSAANLQVNKFSDPLANFTGTTPLGGWTITITGTAGTAAGFTATQQTNGAGQAFFLGIPDGTYTVCETLQSGWANVGSKYNTVTQAGLCRTGVTVNLNQTATVDFYNQPRVTIRVHKTLNVVGFTSNGQGWQFTLTGCGITPQTKTTDANGIADFTDLPPAISCVYTVTETVQPGWTPQFVSQTAQPVAGGQVVTLEFLNIKDFNPPCTDPNDPRCVPPPPPSTPTPTPTGTPTTPTGTPTTPTVTTTPPPTATPTNTPTPTPTNTPVTQVAGERTPGPGASPTPLAPSTGYGFGSAQGGMSLLLVLAGVISLSLGLGFIALGRRTNR